MRVHSKVSRVSPRLAGRRDGRRGVGPERLRDGTTLYIAGGRVFGRIGPSDAVEVLAAWENPDQWIRSIHGHPSTGEVFLAIEDVSLWGHACGAGILVRYDGVEFHRL